jgi:hypothetical protein
MISGSGFTVYGLGFGIRGLGFRMKDVENIVQGLVLRVANLGFRL